MNNRYKYKLTPSEEILLGDMQDGVIYGKGGAPLEPLSHFERRGVNWPMLIKLVRLGYLHGIGPQVLKLEGKESIVGYDSVIRLRDPNQEREAEFRKVFALYFPMAKMISMNYVGTTADIAAEQDGKPLQVGMFGIVYENASRKKQFKEIAIFCNSENYNDRFLVRV